MREMDHSFSSYQHGYSKVPQSIQTVTKNERLCFNFDRRNVCSFLSVFTLLLMGGLWWHSKTAIVHHRETIPTLLSVVDPQTDDYVYALGNPLYSDVLRMNLKTSDLKLREVPTLHVDTLTVTVPQQKITLSWSMGTDHRGNALLNDKDSVLLLQCGSIRQKNVSSPLLLKDHYYSGKETYLLEVVTFSQIKASSGGSEKSWKIEFPLVRHEACQFLWMHRQTIVAESIVLDMRPVATLPTGIHWSNTNGNKSVHFATTAPGTPVLLVNGKRWTGTTTTYTAEQMCGAPANETKPGQFQSPGMLHTITMTGNDVLVDGGQYKVGLMHGQGTTWSETLELRRPTNSYLVYADQGCPKGGWKVLEGWISGTIKREVNVSALHHFGDLSYATGAAHHWEAWMQAIQPLSTVIPLQVGIGNHEYDYFGDPKLDPSMAEASYHPAWGNFENDSGGECGVPVSSRFDTGHSNGNGIFWYSFDHDLVHTIVISSEHDLQAGGVQYRWLERDLQHVNRTVTPWIVVESHRPLYESQAIWYQNAATIGIRYEIEDLLHEHKVDLVLAGHYHAYLRTCSGLYQSTCDNGGPVHICVGTAGADLDSADLYRNNWTERFIPQTYGYGKMTVYNSTSLLFEFLDWKEGSVLDSVLLGKRG